MITSSPALTGNASPESALPWWRRHLFFIAFFVGAALLTALPAMQRRFLSAPPPLGTLTTWRLPTLDGGTLDTSSLRGQVWLAMVVPAGCDGACRERTESFAKAQRHFADLEGKVDLVSLVLPESAELARSMGAQPRWHVVSADRATLAPAVQELRAAWKAWAGADPGESIDAIAAVPWLALVDQETRLRGFWKDDGEGRGNAINAARLLARYGAAP